MLFREKTTRFEAVQLIWDNWNEMCKFADVGDINDGKPMGTYYDPIRGPGIIKGPMTIPDYMFKFSLRLMIPTADSYISAFQNDWVAKDPDNGVLSIWSPEVFDEKYEQIASKD